MKRLTSGICAGLLSLSMGFTSIVPASAAPVMVAKPEVTTNVEQVRDHRRRPHWRYEGRRPHSGYYRYDRHRPGHWNGHRGYRHYRDGYRRHNDGWWYPLAAFGAAAIIGGAIANSQPAYRPVPAYGNSHVNWCANRYRSYRAYDNTFQPYNGPRRQCYSPYSR